MGNDERDFAVKVLIAVAIVGAAWMLWTISAVIVLGFGGVILASALRALSDPIAERFHFHPYLALGLVLVAIVLILGIAAVAVGNTVAEQVGTVTAALPKAIANFQAWMENSALGRLVMDWVKTFGSGREAFGKLAGFATSTFGVIANVLLILFLGLYLAADPPLYRSGALSLLPRTVRRRANFALEDAGEALRRWLLGQLAAMILIGVAVGVGLWVMDVPSALSLGLLAGLLEFIPFVGPILFSIPGILLAFAQDPTQALWVALFYLVVQQIEGNLQRWAVSLPPALALAAVVVFALLFGPLGVLFATPLMVVVMVLVRHLYVEPVIEEQPLPRPKI